MKYSNYLLFLLVFIILVSKTVAQEQGNFGPEQKKLNSIEIFYPLILFKDGTTFPKDYIPMNFGISYSRTLIENRSEIQFGISNFDISYPDYEPFQKSPGEVINRNLWFFSSSYLHLLPLNFKVRTYGLGDITFRYGHEVYHIAYPQWFEQIVGNHLLRDFGISAGLKAVYFFRWNFLLSGEAKYTRFLYRYDKGDLNYSFDKGSSPNLLTFRLKVGYRF